MRAQVDDDLAALAAGTFPVRMRDGLIVNNWEDFNDWLDLKILGRLNGNRASDHRMSERRKKRQASGDGRVRVGDAEESPTGESTELGVDELEAQARALEAAPDGKELAIQAWHRAAIAHSKLGNHEGVESSLVHAEALAGHQDFSASVARKPTAADSTVQVVDDVAAEPDVFLGPDARPESTSEGQAFFGRDDSQPADEPAAAEQAGTADPPAFFGFVP